MKNILFIMYNMAGGGAEKVLINILNHIDYSNCNVDLLLIKEEGIYLDKINKNVKVKSIIPKYKLNNRVLNLLYIKIIQILYGKFPKLIYRLYIGSRYDTEVSFLEGETSRILSYSRNKKSKKIGWVHTDLNKHRTMTIEEERAVYNTLDKVICVSNQSKDSYLSLYPEYSEKVEVIYNLIDKNEIVKLAEDRLDYKFTKKTIVAVGRLVKSKGFDILLKAHKHLIEDGLDVNLVILGEGNLRNELEDLVKELQLEEYVYMPGFSSNPYPYIKNASVYVMSSNYEGFSLVVAEAMVLGKCIVSTNCVGPAELLANGEYGIMVRIQDEMILKDKIKEVLLDVEKCKQYEKKSLKRSEIFSSTDIISKIHKELFG